jgi:very-short-patch-repair endonuclease
MGWKSQRKAEAEAPGRSVWALAERQHGVASRRQLLELGMSRRSIERRLAGGRLHPVLRGVYAVGRPGITRRGQWMAAVLSCGPGAALSHGSAAALWGVAPERPTDPVQVSVRRANGRGRPGVEVHRRSSLKDRDVTVREGIPTTAIVRTLLDLAAELSQGRLERAVNEADRLDLIDPDSLRAVLAAHHGQPGVRRLRELLDRRTFRLTASELERRFLSLAREAGLPPPLTGQLVNGFEVDFYWPGLGLVIETDGLRYHRTPGQQARDRLRDQAHALAGLTALRFTHAQVNFESPRVTKVLTRIATRLAERGPLAPAAKLRR